MLTFRIQFVFDKVDRRPPLPISAKVRISLKVSTKKLQWLKRRIKKRLTRLHNFSRINGAVDLTNAF